MRSDKKIERNIARTRSRSEPRVIWNERTYTRPWECGA